MVHPSNSRIMKLVLLCLFFFFFFTFLILFLPFVYSQTPETAHSHVRRFCLISRLLRPLCEHFAVALGNGIVAKLQPLLSELPCPLFNTMLMHRCSLLCAMCSVVLSYILAVSLASWYQLYFLLAQLPKPFQDIYTEPKEMRFMGQDNFCSVWWKIKSWFHNLKKQLSSREPDQNLDSLSWD